MNQWIIYGLTAIAAAAFIAVFGSGPLSLVVWAYSEWKKDKQKRETRSEVED